MFNVKIDDAHMLNEIEMMIENTLREIRTNNDDVVVDFRDSMIDVSTHTHTTRTNDDDTNDVFVDMKLSCM